MTNTKTATFYLDPGMLESARKGRHNFIKRFVGVLVGAGFRVEFSENGPLARMMSADDPGYSIFHMDDPTHSRAFTMRRNYYYPFWQIETTAKRWEWQVAKTAFDPAKVDRVDAERFFGFWSKRLFDGANQTVTHDGPIYVPLQGLIRDHRSFQSQSPIEMIKTTARHFADRPVVVTLRPNEVYSDTDRTALDAVLAAHKNVALSDAPMVSLLQRCRAVVTQNSSAAFAGYFFRKPAVLFAEIDFHHIAGSVPKTGTEKAFSALSEQRDYNGYLWWFL